MKYAYDPDVRSSRLVLGACAGLITAVVASAGTAADLARTVPPAAAPAITVERLGPRSFRLVSGARGAYDEIGVLVSERGLVLVDTSIAPSHLERLLAAFERETGRRDVAFVVNTHAHADHCNGNQLFADRPIIAHDHVRERMGPAAEDAALRDPMLLRARTASFEARLARGETTLPSGALISDVIAVERTLAADMASGRYRVTPPNLTFPDRLTLHLGDLTVQLHHFPEGLETDADLVAVVPEEGLAFTGDLFWRGSIRLAMHREADPRQLLSAIDELLQPKLGIRSIVTSHQGVLPRVALELRRDYLADLTARLQTAIDQGLAFDAIRLRLPPSAFPALAASGLDDVTLARQHGANLRLFWARLVGARSAAELLEAALASRGIEGLRSTLADLRAGTEKTAYVEEAELNGLGYRLLGASRVREAVAVFESSVVLLPGSAVLWDSLGEARLAAFDRDGARSAYERSLQLDPGNANAARMLERIASPR